LGKEKKRVRHPERRSDFLSVLTDGSRLGDERGGGGGAAFGFGVGRKQIVQVNERRPGRAQKRSGLCVRLLRGLLSCNTIKGPVLL